MRTPTKMITPGQRGCPRGRPPRQSAPPLPTTVSIGNARVEFPAASAFSSDAEGLCIDISETCTVRIKVSKETPIPDTGFSFSLLNPKGLDAAGKLILKDVLKLYSQELPAMNYAANTGKESPFLEKCVFGGKYSTLILRNAKLELIGAMTFQILPTDTNQAELPLAVVAQAHHRQGFGTYLYKELRRRLLDVGLSSIFCWGDQESEQFWEKQGFVAVAQVDGRGKPLKLPVKTDVKRAMSIPGSSSLMISYLSSPYVQPAFPGPSVSTSKCHTVTNGEGCEKTPLEICRTTMDKSPPRLGYVASIGEKAEQKLSPASITTPQVMGENKSNHMNSITPMHTTGELANKDRSFRASITPFNMEGMLSTVASDHPKEIAFNVEGIFSAVVPDLQKENSPELLESPVENNRQPLSDITKRAAPVENSRQLLTDITNSVPVANGAERPLKKRPFTRVGLSKPSNKFQAPISGKVLAKEAVDKKPATTAATRKHGCKGVFQFEMNYDPIPVVSPNERTGSKRCREPEAEMQVFGRRPGRRRKADPVPSIPSMGLSDDRTNKESEKLTNLEIRQDVGRRPNRRWKADPVPSIPSSMDLRSIPSSMDLSDDRTNKEPEKFTNSEIRQDVDQMMALLLPQQRADAGRFIAADAENSAEPDYEGNESGINSGKDMRGFVPDSIDISIELNGAKGETEAGCADSFGAADQSLIEKSPVILFMNLDDESQKKQLTKYVERLAGKVTNDGSECTHVVTGEVRRTLNFCMAISSGAWILSSDWLKMSVKQKSFADEADFVIRDERFEAKYNVSLQDVVRRAKQWPNLLLDGMYIYPTPHIHPPLDTISKIVEAAGGKVLASLEEAFKLEDKSVAVVVATEEDMADAISAAKGGLRTFSSDWLLTCIVKQELDLMATQFSESL